MNVEFERSGGLMGLRLHVIIDTGTLPEHEALALHDMVETARFFDLPETLDTPAAYPDQFTYRLTIDTEGYTHTVSMTDTAAPPELQPLLRQLTRMARSARDT
ncbi:MAG: hypothetical protein JW966_07120 [Anaerolineae bacterium]|nr:hypothetical protein [Anaerolineae bacterium]